MTDPACIIIVEDAQWTEKWDSVGCTVLLTMDDLSAQHVWLADGVILPYQEREL